ncbi:MAG TPA: HisA/HisF-related TIM barrel protein [Vicinamibacterales bacterium]|nr:HisA/HisF-related TIM barrel protein [Vicinamibacterales bacterium]
MENSEVANTSNYGGADSMNIIGVIDLLGGRAVHAQGGCRHGYRPVSTAARVPIDGDPVTLSRVYVDRLGIRELYLADLDAIAGGAEQDEATRAVAALGAPLWLDAGVTTPAQAQRARSRGASRVVVGLETLPSFVTLEEICAAGPGGDVVFSLDLRDGRPVTATLRERAAEALVRQAVDAGVAAVILLDLDRVGSATGLDWALLERVRAAIPDVTLLAGGGVRNDQDLRRLADTGCDGALVATALHNGNLPIPNV